MTDLKERTLAQLRAHRRIVDVAGRMLADGECSAAAAALTVASAGAALVVEHARGHRRAVARMVVDSLAEWSADESVAT